MTPMAHRPDDDWPGVSARAFAAELLAFLLVAAVVVLVLWLAATDVPT